MVEQVRGAFISGIGAPALFANRLQVLVQGERDFLRDFRRKLAQLRQALDGFRADFFGQAQQKRGGLTGVQVGQNEGDGLRMLHFQELCQLLRVGVLQAFQVDGILVHPTGNLVEQLLGARFAEGFDQQFLRIFRAAFRQVTLGDGEPVILFQHGHRGVGLEVLQFGNAPRQALHIVLGKIAVDVAGNVLAQQHHENGRFLQPRVGYGYGHFLSFLAAFLATLY